MTTSNTTTRPIDNFDVWKWHEIRTFLLNHGGTEKCTIKVERYASRGTKNSMYMTVRSGEASISGWAWVPANHSWTSLPHSRIDVDEEWDAELEVYGDDVKRQVKLTLLEPTVIEEEHVPTELVPDKKVPDFDEVENDAIIDRMMEVRGVHSTGMRKMPYAFRARVTFMHADKIQPSIYLNFIKDGVESVGTVRFTAPKHIKPLINKLNNKVCEIRRSTEVDRGPEAFQVFPVEEALTVNANPKEPEPEPTEWRNKLTQKLVSDVQFITIGGVEQCAYSYMDQPQIQTKEAFLRYHTNEPMWFYNIPENGVLCMVENTHISRIVRYENGVLMTDENQAILTSNAVILPVYVQEAMDAYYESMKVI